ncbi:hypothetical protein GH714_006614 [Hevea brasiliensis]|uniref:GOLD domain-containing protein n=1 Tax=Hevea brasiliensis TaxID=3981 RepID=A0A6A6LK29_HEVBR|nr:hypothetical protein GH714_006614 [Hevea brasiliensis]
MVINTVLSVMAYDYSPEKLSVYLSDDGGSEFTFYALLEASKFAKHWIPYCKKFKVEPRSPAVYFASKSNLDYSHHNEQWVAIKKLYEEMEDRIETAIQLGRIPEEERFKHKGFSQWDSYSSLLDHDTILQILIDGKDPNAKDIDGSLPTLVYLAREKRPQHPHHFKAGAMNALIRVSSMISNGSIILNLDCDMYSNNSLSIQDALCFFMDEEKSHDIAFVQYPQHFENLTKNDIYSNSLRALSIFGGPLYIGTGCFHRRDALCGKKFTKDCKFEWKKDDDHKRLKSILELEEETKSLASCTYEQNTQWGNEMGLRYGCAVEDVITGLSIQCRGWKSVYFNPERKAFAGLAPTTLHQTLVQQKRWAEGDFQILFCKYSPLWHAHGKISLGLRLGIVQMGIRLKELYTVVILALLSSLQAVFGIRFVIDREECFSHDIKYEGDTVHVSFVVIKADSTWHYTNDGVDLVVKGPNGDQIHDFRDKISDKFEFMARQRGVHSFCFTNKSPYHETIDFDVHVAIFHTMMSMRKMIWKLEEALYNIQFEQHWLEAQTERQAIVNEAMGRRAIHKDMNLQH